MRESSTEQWQTEWKGEREGRWRHSEKRQRPSVEAKNIHRERKRARLFWKEAEMTGESQSEAKGIGGQEEERVKRTAEKKEKEKSEWVKKRLLSGSEKLFLAVYWLSLSAWLLGGGTAGSHWCHSPVNRPDKETIGPHVVVRKLSVSHAAAAYDIIQDQVRNMDRKLLSVCVTKNTHMHVIFQKWDYGNDMASTPFDSKKHTYSCVPQCTQITETQNWTPCRLYLMALPILWLSSPQICTPKVLVTGRVTTLWHLCTRTHTHTYVHTQERQICAYTIMAAIRHMHKHAQHRWRSVHEKTLSCLPWRIHTCTHTHIAQRCLGNKTAPICSELI